MDTKILVVDDAELNREILKEILKDEYVVLEAKGGKEAIDILEQMREGIAMVLLDLVMPDMDGWARCRF